VHFFPSRRRAVPLGRISRQGVNCAAMRLQTRGWLDRLSGIVCTPHVEGPPSACGPGAAPWSGGPEGGGTGGNGHGADGSSSGAVGSGGARAAGAWAAVSSRGADACQRATGAGRRAAGREWGARGGGGAGRGARRGRGGERHAAPAGDAAAAGARPGRGAAGQVPVVCLWRHGSAAGAATSSSGARLAGWPSGKACRQLRPPAGACGCQTDLPNSYVHGCPDFAVARCCIVSVRGMGVCAAGDRGHAPRLPPPMGGMQTGCRCCLQASAPAALARSTVQPPPQPASVAPELTVVEAARPLHQAPQVGQTRASAELPNEAPPSSGHGTLPSEELAREEGPEPRAATVAPVINAATPAEMADRSLAVPVGAPASLEPPAPLPGEPSGHCQQAGRAGEAEPPAEGAAAVSADVAADGEVELSAADMARHDAAAAEAAIHGVDAGLPAEELAATAVVDVGAGAEEALAEAEEEEAWLPPPPPRSLGTVGVASSASRSTDGGAKAGTPEPPSSAGAEGESV
jgi:hypothetical protein